MLFVRDVFPFEGATVHEFQQDLDFAVVVVHVVTLHHVLVIDVAEDLDLAVDLAADGLLVVAVDHLQGVDAVARSVDDLVDGAAASAADAVEAFELGERDELVSGPGGRGGGGREGEGDRQVGVSLGER